MNKQQDIESFTQAVADLMGSYSDRLSSAVAGHQLITTACDAMISCMKDPLDAFKVIALAVDKGVDDARISIKSLRGEDE